MKRQSMFKQNSLSDSFDDFQVERAFVLCALRDLERMGMYQRGYLEKVPSVDSDYVAEVYDPVYGG